MQSAVWLNSAAETNHYKISHMSRDCTPRGTPGYTNCSSLKCGCLYSEICSNRTTFITCLSVTDFKVNQVEIRTTIFLWLFGLGFVLACVRLFVLNSCRTRPVLGSALFTLVYMGKWFLFFPSESVATSVKIPWEGCRPGAQLVWKQLSASLLSKYFGQFISFIPLQNPHSIAPAETILPPLLCTWPDKTQRDSSVQEPPTQPLSHCQSHPRALAPPLVWDGLKIQYLRPKA